MGDGGKFDVVEEASKKKSKIHRKGQHEELGGRMAHKCGEGETKALVNKKITANKKKCKILMRKSVYRISKKSNRLVLGGL